MQGFTGRGRLMERPQTVYEDLYEMRMSEGKLRVRGQLKPGRYETKDITQDTLIKSVRAVLKND